MKHTIDFNADLGEGCPNDAALMELVTSVNIACGAHAGSNLIMMETVRLAKLHGLRLGAHPGYPDRANFGRIERHITPAKLYTELQQQVVALDKLAQSFQLPLSYVKPHGAMYHQCARDAALAKSLIVLAKQLELAIMGLPGTVLEAETQAAGLHYIREGFADRRYQPEGTLTPRSQPDAMLRDPLESAKQVRWLIDTQGVESICVHGDEPGAVDFLKQVKAHLAGGSA
jgi:5-oxoprolinase (ATP-hydrolysing) subunit A